MHQKISVSTKLKQIEDETNGLKGQGKEEGFSQEVHLLTEDPSCPALKMKEQILEEEEMGKGNQ